MSRRARRDLAGVDSPEIPPIKDAAEEVEEESFRYEVMVHWECVFFCFDCVRDGPVEPDKVCVEEARLLAWEKLCEKVPVQQLQQSKVRLRLLSFYDSAESDVNFLFCVWELPGFSAERRCLFEEVFPCTYVHRHCPMFGFALQCFGRVFSTNDVLIQMLFSRFGCEFHPCQLLRDLFVSPNIVQSLEEKKDCLDLDQMKQLDADSSDHHKTSISLVTGMLSQMNLADRSEEEMPFFASFIHDSELENLPDRSEEQMTFARYFHSTLLTRTGGNYKEVSSIMSHVTDSSPRVIEGIYTWLAESWPAAIVELPDYLLIQIDGELVLSPEDLYLDIPVLLGDPGPSLPKFRPGGESVMQLFGVVSKTSAWIRASQFEDVTVAVHDKWLKYSSHVGSEPLVSVQQFTGEEFRQQVLESSELLPELLFYRDKKDGQDPQLPGFIDFPDCRVHLYEGFLKKCSCGSREHLKICSRCHAMWYCSTKCQKSDWRHHSLVCSPTSMEDAIQRRRDFCLANLRSINDGHRKKFHSLAESVTSALERERGDEARIIEPSSPENESQTSEESLRFAQELLQEEMSARIPRPNKKRKRRRRRRRKGKTIKKKASNRNPIPRSQQSERQEEEEGEMKESVIRERARLKNEQLEMEREQQEVLEFVMLKKRQLQHVAGRREEEALRLTLPESEPVSELSSPQENENVSILLSESPVDPVAVPSNEQTQIAASASEESDPSIPDEYLCVVCMEAKKRVLFQPCMHLACCQPCGKSLENCPLCRCPIDSRLVAFL